MKALFDLDELSRARSSLYKRYRDAQDRYSLQPADETLGRLFSFADNSQKPIHGWYAFKEGFAAELVGKFINRFHVARDSGLVVDPFCGSGTTALEAQLRGLEARGVEVNPFFVAVASTKLRWHEVDTSIVRSQLDAILRENDGPVPEERAPQLTSFHRLYSEDVLAELLRLKARIRKDLAQSDVTKDFLLLGLTSILELTSRAYKTGKGLKFRKRQTISSPQEVRDNVREKWRTMVADVEELKARGVQTGSATVVQGDARALPIDDSSAALILYSPPYANTFDYNEVYKLEMWFLDYVTSYEEWRRVKEASLRSHVSLRIGSQDEGDELLEAALSFMDTPVRGEKEMLRAYFADMKRALGEQKRVAKKGGHVVIVVGNSSYRYVPIATDLILARIAESLGFHVECIEVGRHLNTSSQQMAVYNAHRDTEGRKFVRESAVILRR